MKAGTYIAIIVALGFVLIGYLFFISPATAGAQLPLILTALGGIIALLAKSGEIDRKVDENTAVTNITHQIVNSQRTEMLAKIEGLEKTVSALRTEKAVAQSVNMHTDDGMARIASAIEAATAETRPIEVPPS